MRKNQKNEKKPDQEKGKDQGNEARYEIEG